MEPEIIKSDEPLHTEEIQDIIGKPPRWLYRWGISLVLAIAVTCIFISSLISYPEAIQTRIKVLSANLPCQVSLKDSTKLIKILVQNNNKVKKGDSIAVIETGNGKVSIKAPIDGKLTYAGIIHEGEELAPNQHIFSISMDDQIFYGEIVIPQNEVYKVKPGQTVLVKLSPPTDEKHGMLRGTIKYVTNDQFKNEQYLAEVDLDNINNNEAGYLLLRNGMIADAEVITAEASLFHRLIHSLTKAIK